MPTQKSTSQKTKQIVSVRGLTVVLKQDRGFKFAGVYTGLIGRVPKYLIQVRDANDLTILKAIFSDKNTQEELVKVLEKFILS